MTLTLLGEALLLFGFVLLASSGRSLLVQDCMAALPASPWRDATLILLIAGFGLKAGLVPLHIWVPLNLHGGTRSGRSCAEWSGC